MKPYYKRAGVTLYHGDCREVVPTLKAIDAVVADPPYGIAWKQGANNRPGHQKTFFGAASNVIGDERPFDPSLLLPFPIVVCWGANYYADKLPAGRGWLIWYKTDGIGNTCFSDAEVAWCSTLKTTKVFKHRWAGCVRASELRIRRVHPTQKPIDVMAWCMQMAKVPVPATVLDPYMGSGTTGVACLRTGRKFIGIEIDERYCEVAAKRLEAEAAAERMAA